MSNKKIAIIGIGEVPAGTYPDRSSCGILYDICIQPVKDAGIHKNNRGVITVASQAQPQLTAEISFGMIPGRTGVERVQKRLHLQRRRGLYLQLPSVGRGYEMISISPITPPGHGVASV